MAEKKTERWIELREKFDYRVPASRSVISFKPGRYFMTKAQADEAVRLGKGTPSPKVETDVD